MFLVKNQRLMESLQFSGANDYAAATQDQIDAGEAALHETTIFLEGKLRTRFALSASNVDLFHVRFGDSLPTNLEGSSFHTQFLLKRGLVRSSPVVGVVAAQTVTGLAGSTATDVRDVSGVDHARISDELGVVHVYDLDLTDHYVEITYDSGFSIDSTDSNLYNQSEVPDWLQEVALLHAKIMIRQNPTLNHQGDEDAPIKSMWKTLGMMLESHIRYVPVALTPQ